MSIFDQNPVPTCLKKVKCVSYLYYNHIIAKLPAVFEKSYKINSLTYTAFKISQENNYIVDGRNKVIDGNNLCCHLLHIHDSDVIIKNLTLTGGNTEVIRKLKRSQIDFPKPKGSIFEIIDGGAVLITGKSDVVFENCRFIDNNALMCGGAISNQSSRKVIFRNCLFEDNRAGHTGAAIDNLVRGSDIEVERCIFKSNKSNTWNHYDSPHGQITLFPGTKGEIIKSKFSEGSIPFDYKDEESIILEGNNYSNYVDWSEDKITRRSTPLFHHIAQAKKLYWLPFKTRWDVYYRIN